MPTLKKPRTIKITRKRDAKIKNKMERILERLNPPKKKKALASKQKKKNA